PGSGPDTADDDSVCLREGTTIPRRRTDQGLRIEVAAARILEDAVLDAIDHVALRDRRLCRGGRLARRQQGAGLAHEEMPPQLLDVQFRKIDRRRTGQDAVVVAR